MAEGQDDAEQRVNGLMSSLGKRTAERDAALARIAELERTPAPSWAQEPAPVSDGTDSANSQPETDPEQHVEQPEYEDGISYRWDAGSRSMVEDNPTPARPNGPKNNSRERQDDGSAEYANDLLGQALGATPVKTSWP